MSEKADTKGAAETDKKAAATETKKATDKKELEKTAFDRLLAIENWMNEVKAKGHI